MRVVFLLSSWFPVVVWAALIFSLSGVPHLNSGLGLWDYFLRKGAHMVEFGVLTLLFLRGFRRTWPHRSVRAFWGWSGILAVSYALSDEFHQSFVAGRGSSLKDVAIDACGVILALVFFRNRFNLNRAGPGGS